jgi:preprotein translocase subunit Sss1
MRRKRVDFDAEKIVKKPTEVEFTTKDGTRVDFIAKKPTKEEVHVEFLAKPKKK